MSNRLRSKRYQSASRLVLLLLCACVIPIQVQADSASSSLPWTLRGDIGSNPVTGDFDGNGTQDWLFVLHTDFSNYPPYLSGPRFRPWPEQVDRTTGAYGLYLSYTKLVFIHCHAGKVRCANPQTYVVEDANRPSILDTNEVQDLTVVPLAAIREEYRGEMPGPTDRTVVIVPTGAGIDTFLYWTGSGYAAFEPLVRP